VNDAASRISVSLPLKREKAEPGTLEQQQRGS